jgi:L-rhamnonate dehydratase
MKDTQIIAIEGGSLYGQRPRKAGSNARLGEHGTQVRVPLARVTAEDGSTGFGFYEAGPEQARPLLNRRMSELFSEEGGVQADGLAFDYPLWDLMGRRAGQPVYALAATLTGVPVPASLRVRCYDTSLYFDDLHLTDEAEAAALIAAEAREGYARGHRAFKIKVGRGARHLPLEAGTRRDIAIIHAVQEAVGPEIPLMLDANNGYNLNLTKQVLEETSDCRVFWMEEAFHEDPVLYRDLKAWLQARQSPLLIADGEGSADPNLLAFARDKLVDVIQYDIFGHGFTRWLSTGRQLDSWNVRSAPHHYGGHYGNYVTCHLAAAIRGFTFTEWDEVTTPGLDASAYALDEGSVAVPNRPGFGLELDEAAFTQAVETNGFSVH